MNQFPLREGHTNARSSQSCGTPLGRVPGQHPAWLPDYFPASNFHKYSAKARYIHATPHLGYAIFDVKPLYFR